MLKQFYYDWIFRAFWFVIECVVKKRADHWAFSTHYLQSHLFIENQRAVFEAVKADPAIKKIIFHRPDHVDLVIENAVNTELVKYGTWRSFLVLARCKVVFLTNSIAMDFSIRWGTRNFSVVRLCAQKRIVVNLWHGIALKRLFNTANTRVRVHTERVGYRRDERKGYSGLIVSSDIDSYAMCSMFYPLCYEQVWITGLPRNDFLLKAENELPVYLRESIAKIRKIKNEKRLVVYAPTYRQVNAVGDAFYYQFDVNEITRLKQLLHKHNAVLGFRPHYFKNATRFFNMAEFIDNEVIFDLSYDVIPDIAAIVRECDVIVTDYSSVYIEALYLNKPIVSFAYDLDDYRDNQDGLLYDMDLVFPARINKTFDELLAAIGASLQHKDIVNNHQYKAAQNILYQYTDSHNSDRVVTRVNSLLSQS